MRILRYIPALTCLLSAPALADSPRDADATTITVTGAPLPLIESGQSVSVIDSDTIDAIQGADLTRVLSRLPGVQFARNGGLGAQTGIFVRGAESDQLLVTIDGVRVADLAAPGGNYDTGPLALNGIGRIELLRGSNSVVWGSQAMGGVLAITTRDVNGGEASAEYGAYNTTTLDGTAGIAREKYAISAEGGYTDSDGFPARVGGTHDDGIESYHVSGKARVELADGLTLKAVARYADSKLGVALDGPDSPDTQWTHDTSGGVTLAYKTGGLTLDAVASLADVRRYYDETLYGTSFYQGREERFELHGHTALPWHLAADFGAEHEWDKAISSYDDRASDTTDAGYALLGYYSDRLTLAAGGRVDSHSQFGSHWTAGANGVFRIAEGWRLRGAYGEGFKAPTLYQLYDPYSGYTALKPETSRNYEAGIERKTDVFHASATWFQRDSRNLIDYVLTDPVNFNYGYRNVSRARAYGVELEAGVQLGATLAASVNYTLLHARNLDTGLVLARRPKNTVNLSLDWTAPLHGLTLGGDLTMVSNTVDYDFFGDTLNIASHVTATLRAAYALTRRFEVYGRIENVSDAKYETAYGYNAAGRAAYVGVRAKL